MEGVTTMDGTTALAMDGATAMQWQRRQWTVQRGRQWKAQKQCNGNDSNGRCNDNAGATTAMEGGNVTVTTAIDGTTTMAMEGVTITRRQQRRWTARHNDNGN